ncbi:glutamine-hydrolyzing carbamoyl-phosphate synthase small subunit [Buchnera aphidicola str. APS (Acyrthosiphon pisum)]|uniref:Carbamoyl phosphate synthase small chain n=1 Tax=Buchnera aphidicola subsp. Acyrthosiphon pisum (strain APS) TaxID=107806 RepID=CARA_BUCAI|nr:glutamine-hydrolyzing carbamoyl-phosphate synthase small subunit [Buchnera aphidicola]P57245.1 RecName: Full=Carbamoyl phosphate synthase small chain; AltName: Full=Carbamoyl phosphate synthetase glutamine chain [Buchnera aphidicola str. APS (Acyrthosiphon pisum)]pir/G84946/ carbamoyl-phosphate synthase (glutamine-hydrolyzing) (EC 6.3.5.5) small chain [imported] - Buchnera sp. (strain APS) [Buchnera sp. (in: enterobacteria)]BAB12863.1 carbamoyl-phosphate synthase small chain [Buchnera aphidic
MEGVLSQLAVLVLEDGTKFHGRAIGAKGITVGEVVFNTSITGYQEIITDPSYSHQIVTLTHPHIGNVGTNSNDEESSKIYIKGLIIRDLSLTASNYRNKKSFSSYLKENNIIAISDIDTRKLTRILRTKGSQNGCIIEDKKQNYSIAYNKAKNFISLQDLDLAKKVSTKSIYNWDQGSFTFKKNNFFSINKQKFLFHVVVYDFGVKRNILRMLVDRGCYLTVVPAITDPKTVLNLSPDGIFLSNGPGDPRPCDYAIHAIQYFLKTNIPIFGICLGHQLLALASGAKIVKMKFGHHGGNHPVKDIKNNRVIITSQNHSFTVDTENLPNNIEITHSSLFDGTLQGLSLTNKSAFSFQGHPEASPGPHDASYLFDYFIKLIVSQKTTLSN